MTAVLEATLRYAAKGWPVFPCNGKRPYVEHGLLDATTDPDTIREWWRRWPDANIAIRTGSASGLLIVDADDLDELHELEREHGELPRTASVTTPRGGQHYWFRHPVGTVPSSAGKLAPGIDVRADGGYAIAPPSRGYVVDEEAPLAGPPAWLVERARDTRRNGHAPPVEDVISKGGRNAELTSIAGTMRRRGLGEAEILAALAVANRVRCKPPLPEDEVARVAASVCRYEPAERPDAASSAEEAVPDEASSTRPVATAALATAYTGIRREPVEWLWPGRIPLGMLTMLVGDPGLGKSLLTCDLAAKVSRAGAATLLLTAEDSPAATVRPRLEAAGADLELVHNATLIRDGVEEGLSFPDEVQQLDERVADTGARLVVIDPLMAHLPAQVNSWRDQSVRTALAPLYRLATERSCAVVLVLHLNKMKGADPLHRVGGSIGIPGAVRSALLLARDPEDRDGERGNRRVLAHVKCNLAPLAASLSYDIEPIVLPGDDRIETARLRLLGESGHSGHDLLDAPRGEERSALDEAVDVLRAELGDGDRNAREVMATVRAVAGVSERTVKTAKQALGVEAERVGGVAARGHWVWRLPKWSPPQFLS